jgi:hypothetical protein
MEEEKKDGIGMNVFIILNCRARENRASEREKERDRCPEESISI